MLHSGKLTPGAEDLVLGCEAVAAAFSLCPTGFLSKLPISFRQCVLSSESYSPKLDTLFHSPTKKFLPKLSLLR